MHVSSLVRWELLFFVFLTVGCSQELEPRRLIGPFASHQSPSEVAQLLREKQLSWMVVDQSKPRSASDTRPAFSILEWEVAGLRIDAIAGQARFVFFNDRLTEVRIFPDDPQALESLAGMERTAPRGVRVFSGHDYRGRHFVSFQDSALQHELEEYIRTYASRPDERCQERA